jgi:hypothetical protein
VHLQGTAPHRASHPLDRHRPGSAVADWRHHAFLTDLDGNAVAIDAFDRHHAVVELAIRDLKEGAGLEHVPSGHFFANGAWLCFAVLAHNLIRWSATLGQPHPSTALARTVRTRLLAVPGAVGQPLRHSDPARSSALALGATVHPAPVPPAHPRPGPHLMRPLVGRRSRQPDLSSADKPRGLPEGKPTRLEVDFPRPRDPLATPERLNAHADGAIRTSVGGSRDKGGRCARLSRAITDKVTEVVVLGPRFYEPAATPLHDARHLRGRRHEDLPNPVAQLKWGLIWSWADVERSAPAARRSSRCMQDNV